ncbi:MAG: App1 family protein [Pseudomonadota bacterium]
MRFMPIISAFVLLFNTELTLAFSDNKYERLIFFPSVISQKPDGAYSQKFHILLLEEDFDVLKQKAITNLVMPMFGVDEEERSKPAQTRILERAKWFAFDPIEFSQHTMYVDHSSPIETTTDHLGHIKFEIPLTTLPEPKTFSNVALASRHGVKISWTLSPITINNQGVSVISDIDDTLKISNVVSKTQLIRSTFVEPYRAVEEMLPIFRELEQQGAFFHYVSASPWQIWPSLEPFMRSNFPRGQLHLRNFSTSMYDRDFYNFMFGSSVSHKKSSIEKILADYPLHKFILIGDTSECDPEIYGAIARKYSTNIEEIILRRVPHTDFSDQRIQSALFGVDRQTYRLVGPGTVSGAHNCDG